MASMPLLQTLHVLQRHGAGGTAQSAQWVPSRKGLENLSDGQEQGSGQPTRHGVDAVALIVLDPVDARHKLFSKLLRRRAPPNSALRFCITYQYHHLPD
ncbi:hypothetical protein MMC34_008639, partial [Xylographa carneopallida]|nr:hypothetical protein [Xylographa carneopallida]